MGHHPISRHKPSIMQTTPHTWILSLCGQSCPPNCSQKCTRLPRQIIGAQVSKNLWPKIFLTHTWCTVIMIVRKRATMPNKILITHARVWNTTPHTPRSTRARLPTDPLVQPVPSLHHLPALPPA